MNCQLSSKRKVTLSDFKNQKYVNIREFYDKDGKELPGKKVRLMPPFTARACICAGSLPLG